MKKRANTIRNILIAAGIIEIAVGLLHFAMPYFAYQSKGFTLLQPAELDFVTLCVFAIGILLLAFGTITIFLAFKVESATEVVLFYVVIKTVLFLARVVLEFLYPVNIGLFYIKPFTVIAMPGMIVEFLLFALTVILLRKYMTSLSSID